MSNRVNRQIGNNYCQKCGKRITKPNHKCNGDEWMVDIDDIRISKSNMTDNIYAGKISSDGTRFIGKKRDVTSDFLKAVIDRWEGHKEQIVTPDGKKYWVSVEEEVD